MGAAVEVALGGWKGDDAGVAVGNWKGAEEVDAAVGKLNGEDGGGTGGAKDGGKAAVEGWVVVGGVSLICSASVDGKRGFTGLKSESAG